MVIWIRILEMPADRQLHLMHQDTRVQCLVQGQFNMWPRGNGTQTRVNCLEDGYAKRLFTNSLLYHLQLMLN